MRMTYEEPSQSCWSVTFKASTKIKKIVFSLGGSYLDIFPIRRSCDKVRKSLKAFHLNHKNTFQSEIFSGFTLLSCSSCIRLRDSLYIEQLMQMQSGLFRSQSIILVSTRASNFLLIRKISYAISPILQVKKQTLIHLHKIVSPEITHAVMIPPPIATFFLILFWVILWHYEAIFHEKTHNFSASFDG